METTAVSVVTIYGICTYRLHFQEGIRKKAKKKQECIPVGCVPPALCLGGWGFPDRDPHGQTAPLDTDLPPWTISFAGGNKRYV